MLDDNHAKAGIGELSQQQTQGRVSSWSSPAAGSSSAMTLGRSAKARAISTSRRSTLGQCRRFDIEASSVADEVEQCLRRRAVAPVRPRRKVGQAQTAAPVRGADVFQNRHLAEQLCGLVGARQARRATT